MPLIVTNYEHVKKKKIPLSLRIEHIELFYIDFPKSLLWFEWISLMALSHINSRLLIKLSFTIILSMIRIAIVSYPI